MTTRAPTAARPFRADTISEALAATAVVRAAVQHHETGEALVMAWWRLAHAQKAAGLRVRHRALLSLTESDLAAYFAAVQTPTLSDAKKHAGLDPITRRKVLDWLRRGDDTDTRVTSSRNVCHVCAAVLRARGDARTCSSACRQRAYRQRQGAGSSP